MTDVFISYAREDRARADQIARALQATGLQCWWDSEIPPGQTWADFTEAKLDACKSVIVLWSANSIGSQWVREEARMGRDKGKLIPVILDGSTVPFGFGEVQAANLSAWRGETNHPDWARLARAVHHKVRGVDAPVPPPPPAAPSLQGFTSAVSQMTASAGAAEENSPIGYIKKCLRLYFNGHGRARRSEYWWWVLFAVAVAVVATIFDATWSGWNSYTSSPNTPLFSGVAGLGLLAPGISVAARRFHDVGLSGWLIAGVMAMYLIGAAISVTQPAIAGAIFLIVLGGATVVLFLPSKPGENAYGPNPKGQ
jgi:uncharacterized membrane protein YhaH (DUF805 family)